ncbi:TPA: hypothetical protein U1C81_000564 [Streptococcus suis]|nr:hypothetical protein [Streptococcus suis]HEM3666832.1 hypothetical protein [Streptococcus suis]HEM3720808.1 hypothetical protein [Streptococcus suis]
MEIKIIKKSIYDFVGNRIGSNWGLEVIPTDEMEKSFAPVYPYSSNKESLEEFVSMYEQELTSFFDSGEHLYFCRYVWKDSIDRRENEKDRWYQKGVIIN